VKLLPTRLAAASKENFSEPFGGFSRQASTLVERNSKGAAVDP
jgi:hypothetical protein